MIKRLLNQRRAVGLTRVSTDEKRQELGAAAQRAAIVSWAASNGVEIVAWHADEASGTASIEGRPGLVAAIGDMSALDAGTLIVSKVDRLARDPLVSALTARDVERAGGRIIAADGAGNGGSPADNLMRTMLGAFATFEAATIRGRIKAALAVKKSRGERLGAAPYGFRAVGPKGKGAGFALEAALVPVAEEQATIAAICELRADGLSVREIAAELERRGVLGRPWKGERRPLSAQAVHGLMKAAASSV